MKKLRLIAVQSQKKALLEDLLKLGCVQVSESEADLEGLMNTLRDRRDEGAMERRSQQIKILNALKVLDQYAPVKKGLLTPKPEAEKEAFLDEQALHAIEAVIMIEYARCNNMTGDAVLKAFDGKRRTQISAQDRQAREALAHIRSAEDTGKKK